MEFGIASISNFLTASIVASLTLVTFLGGKNTRSRAFTFTIFVVFLWIVSHAFFHGAQTEALAYVFVRMNFFLGSIIAIGFFYFATVFYDQKNASWQTLIPLVVTTMVFAVLFFGPDTNHMILSGVKEHPWPQSWSWTKGPLWYFFDVLFSSFWTAGLIMLFLKYKKSTGEERKSNLFLFVGMILGVIPTFLMNILLPDFGYFALDWLGTITSLGWVSVVGYSILKFNQMSIKIVTTEILILTAILLLFFSIFI